MLVSRLVPLLVMAGIGVHSGPAIKKRLSASFGAVETVAVKQRMVSIVEVARLQAASGEEDLNLSSDAAFRAFVRKNVRIKGDRKGDPSLDVWGTAMKHSLRGSTLAISSAGPDKKFGGKDDITHSGNIYDY